MIAGQLSSIAAASVPHSLRPWLFDRGSLTQRLRALGAPVSVRVLAEQHQVALNACPHWPVGSPLWVREVLLCVAETPWIYALTEIPLATLSLRSEAFQGLGNTPLGALLFSDPAIEVGVLHFSQQPLDSRPAQLAQAYEQAVTQPLWSRSREFWLAEQPLRVNETFLPFAQQCIAQRDKDEWGLL
ncbi:MAG: chorismate lyase [Ferrimonas sp.]